jgi:hypothetical protein
LREIFFCETSKRQTVEFFRKGLSNSTKWQSKIPKFFPLLRFRIKNTNWVQPKNFGKMRERVIFGNLIQTQNRVLMISLFVPYFAVGDTGGILVIDWDQREQGM